MPRCDTGELELEYEVLEPAGEAAGTLLMIMGLGAQMIHWPDGLLRELVAAGYRVVRFDNRDAGLSSALQHLRPLKSGKMAQLRWLMGRRFPAHYSLRDMAGDAIALLDHLHLDEVHVVGASMGGMIAQYLAIDHPGRLQSATIIMSTTGRRTVGQPKFSVLQAMFTRPRSRSREDLLDHSVSIWRRFQGRVHRDSPEEIRILLGRALDRSFNPSGFVRQWQAIMNAENREPQLRQVRVPTLVLHGRDDPLVAVSGGRAVARAIPGAKLIEIDGWGHDFPASLHGQLAGHILGHVEAVARGKPRTSSARAVPERVSA